MKTKSKVKRNLIYQTAYQILNTCLPLITSPYLARVLGASQQGIFSFTQSIVNYFTLFAMLGVVNYGTRTIAEIGENKERRSKAFWNIYVLQLLMSILAIVIYSLYAFFICKNNILITWIQGFYILGSLVDVNWVFFGVEKFDITVKRSLVIRVITFLMIIFLVKKPDDLWKYTLIMAGGTFASNIILWSYLPTVINIRDIKSIAIDEVNKHIKPNLVLFVPLLAMSVFHIMDKTMLGIFSTFEQTGYYYNADKVINIPISIINGIGTVMLPRMSNLAEAGEKDSSEKLFKTSVELIIMISVAMAMGIAAISNEFTPFFFGKGFEPCVELIILLSPVLIIKSLSQTSRMQFLIPQHHEDIFIQSVIIGAVINFIVNFCLISIWGAMGAVLGTIIAELATCCWQYIRMNKYINTSRTIYKSLIYVLFGILMFVLIRLISGYLPLGVIRIILEIIIGGIIYSSCCILYWKICKKPYLSIILKK